MSVDHLEILRAADGELPPPFHGYMTIESYAAVGKRVKEIMEARDFGVIRRADRYVIVREAGNLALHTEYRRLSAFTRLVIWLDDKLRGTRRS